MIRVGFAAQTVALASSPVKKAISPTHEPGPICASTDCFPSIRISPCPWKIMLIYSTSSPSSTRMSPSSSKTHSQYSRSARNSWSVKELKYHSLHVMSQGFSFLIWIHSFT